ncbi:hypothetical protein PIB30_098841 [Stylosanthes scabra]|uniref:Uncharacterized protein n=1 Tax=Stylosanthes scabra TaxID=79078 RepID=A0ABU6RWZ9_9FABA|nr:hypothetical protein [Stylosanthes scabra]
MGILYCNVLCNLCDCLIMPKAMGSVEWICWLLVVIVDGKRVFETNVKPGIFVYCAKEMDSLSICVGSIALSNMDYTCCKER